MPSHVLIYAGGTERSDTHSQRWGREAGAERDRKTLALKTEAMQSQAKECQRPWKQDEARSKFSLSLGRAGSPADTLISLPASSHGIQF